MNQMSEKPISHPSKRTIFKLTQYLINTQEMSNKTGKCRVMLSFEGVPPVKVFQGHLAGSVWNMHLLMLRL